MSRPLPRLSARIAPAALAVALILAPGWEPSPGRVAVPAAHAAPAAPMGVPLPPRTRSDPRRPHLFASGRSFRATVDFYRRFLARRGIAHEAVPVYRYRGAVVARFLSRQPGTDWSAIHVYQREGRTWIFLVSGALTRESVRGKEPSPSACARGSLSGSSSKTSHVRLFT